MHDSLRALVDWRPSIGCVLRRRCHYIELDVRHLPKRYLASALRLQLKQMAGVDRPGFAYRLSDGKALLWYWGEEDLHGEDFFVAENRPARDAREMQPWPEPLFHYPLDDGLHLLACRHGYDAQVVRGGVTRHTRWFRALPTEAQWLAFVRDAGLIPADHPMPEARRTVPRDRPDGRWKLVTTLIAPVPLSAWLTALAFMVAGAALIGGLIYDRKLVAATEEAQAELTRLRRDSANILALRQQAGAQQAFLAAFHDARPPLTQTELLDEFAATGLFGEPGEPSLWEWEFRNGRLRALFALPKDGIVLGDFLARLETIPVLANLRLIADTPPGIVGIQAEIAPRPSSQTGGAAPAALPREAP